MIRPLAILVLAAHLGAAQGVSIESAGQDRGDRILRIDAVDAPVLEVLTRAAAALGVPLKVEPSMLVDLDRRTVTILRARVVLDELALLMGAKLSMAIGVEDGALVVRPRPEGREARGAQALAHVDHAMLGHPDPQLMPGLRYQRACLLLDAGHAADAALAFADFVDDFPGHELSAPARLKAVIAALGAGLHAAALENLAAVEGASDAIPPVPGAALLPARVHAAAGNLEEASLHARKVAATGLFERDRALAGLLAAEVEYRVGNGHAMLASLDGLPVEFDRTCRDLSPKASLARGLALSLLGDARAGLLHLRVALRGVEDPVKPVAAEAISDCLLASELPVPAWVALRQAEALESDAAESRRLRIRRAGLEEQLGASSRAVGTCTAILRDAEGPFAGADCVLAILSRCFVATDRLEDARIALDALADCEPWRGFALHRLALLERRAGDPGRALRALARLDAATCKPPGPTADELRTLRGELLLEIGDAIQAAEVFRGCGEEDDR